MKAITTFFPENYIEIIDSMAKSNNNSQNRSQIIRDAVKNYIIREFQMDKLMEQVHLMSVEELASHIREDKSNVIPR